MSANKLPHCDQCNDPNYVPPSPQALEQLREGIESANQGNIVFRAEDFAKYADDALPSVGLLPSPEDPRALAAKVKQQCEDARAHADNECRRIRETAALTAACKTLRPANGWPDESWDALWHIDPKGDAMTAWLLSERRLTFLERCKVGWQLWVDGVARYPWPVRNNKEFE
jgi:hypothetical protein